MSMAPTHAVWLTLRVRLKKTAFGRSSVAPSDVCAVCVQGMELNLRKLAEKVKTEEQQFDMGSPGALPSDEEFGGQWAWPVYGSLQVNTSCVRALLTLLAVRE